MRNGYWSDSRSEFWVACRQHIPLNAYGFMFFSFYTSLQLNCCCILICLLSLPTICFMADALITCNDIKKSYWVIIVMSTLLKNRMKFFI